MWPLITGLFTKATVGKALLGTASSLAVGAIQRKQAKKDLAEQRSYEAGSLQRMRDAASKAGFNPLTAFRAGALSAFNTPGRILPPGGVAFAAQYLGDAIGEAFDKQANEPIDKYNAEIRRLEILQRQADLSIARATLGTIGKNTDLYSSYGEYIPVRVGDNLQQLEVSVAKRLGIEPMSRLTAGDMEEIKGDVWGSIDGAVQTDIGDRVLVPAPLIGTPIIQQKTLPKNPPALSRAWFENIFNQADPNWTRIGG